MLHGSCCKWGVPMVRVLRFFLKAAIVFGLLVLGLRLLFPLPSLEGRSVSTAIPPSSQTQLGKVIIPLMAKHAGTSGVTPLAHGPDALALRILLADAAQQTLDAQYYIWHDDASGLFLLDALRRAAQRGVRVRLLVDDNGTPHLDQELAALSALPDFEVRIFNPFVLRAPRVASYLFDFPRLNRRMHNKSFTVDGVATIVGGRNIGDIYFAYGNDGRYIDLDVLAVGQAAIDVSDNFDLFWASKSSYPSDLIVESDGGGLELLAAEVADAKANPDSEIYIAALKSSKMIQHMIDGNLPLEWVRVQMVSDDPAKGLHRVERELLMITRLANILGEVTQSIDLISAYFIPGKHLTEYLVDKAKSGVKTRTLTNSQEATDVLPVHAGYVKYRDDLLAAGVEVYELKSTQVERKLSDQFGVLGSSATSLHAKTFTLDNRRIFIGSFNFDPRSANLNCEMGFLIESPRISKIMTAQFDTQIKQAAYQAILTGDNATKWTELMPDGTVINHQNEPNTSALSRGIVRFIGWLPIEWML